METTLETSEVETTLETSEVENYTRKECSLGTIRKPSTPNLIHPPLLLAKVPLLYILYISLIDKRVGYAAGALSPGVYGGD